MKHSILILIALLIYSISWCQNDYNSSTGDVEDTICVPISTIKIANAKMIELGYEKEINRNLMEIVYNDSIIISNLSSTLDKLDCNYNKELKKVRTQRNVCGGIGIVSVILLIISIL